MTYVALTIAGSDPSGGAGIQADLKTFHQRGVYGLGVVTLITIQNTCGVRSVEPLPPELISGQLEAVLSDIPPAAAKTGALGSAAVICAVAEAVSGLGCPLVVDPVMISKHGAPLLPEDARPALVEKVLPLAYLVTPNLQEAAVLSGIPVTDVTSMEAAARRIAGLGPRAVLVKGGHLREDAIDLLYRDGRARWFSAARVETKHTHGTGCTYSAAIVAELAKGRELEAAVETAKRFITEAIRTNPGLGRGCGPVNHHAVIEG